MKLKVVEVIKDTPDTVCIKFESDLGDYKPGQFVMVDYPTEEKIVKRAYSIASSPTKDTVDVYVKEMPNGFVSKELQSIKEGVEFDGSGPFGHFVFDENKSDDIVLIGAGSGVAPFLSMIEYINDHSLSTKVKLFISNRFEADIIGRKVLESESGTNDNIDLLFNVTRDYENVNWDGKKGRIDQEYLCDNLDDLNGKTFFLCGPLDFVKSIKEILFDLGIDKSQIKQEAYG